MDNKTKWVLVVFILLGAILTCYNVAINNKITGAATQTVSCDWTWWPEGGQKVIVDGVKYQCPTTAPYCYYPGTLKGEAKCCNWCCSDKTSNEYTSCQIVGPGSGQQTPYGQCIDTDGGLNYGVKGSVSIPGALDANGKQIVFYDVCKDSNTLYEEYCNLVGNSYQYAIKTYSCLAGKTCSDGACRSPSAQSNCVADWQCGKPSACIKGQIEKRCTDKNQCDTQNLKKTLTENCTSNFTMLSILGSGDSAKKTLTVGETWDVIGDYTLTAKSIDAKANPRQVWLELKDKEDGYKWDDAVLSQDDYYVYKKQYYNGQKNVEVFSVFIDSIFAGATTDMVQLRYAYINEGENLVFSISAINLQCTWTNCSNGKKTATCTATC